MVTPETSSDFWPILSVATQHCVMVGEELVACTLFMVLSTLKLDLQFFANCLILILITANAVYAELPFIVLGFRK